MKYLCVKWIHNFPNESIIIYSELDGNYFETRKVEVYSNGTKGFSSKTEEFGGTYLSTEPIPPINQIVMDPEFIPEEITKEEFEKIWQGRLQHLDNIL